MSLSARELEGLVRELEADDSAWRDHVRHDALERVCVQLRADADVEVWLVCWSPGQDTGFHDHDDAAAAIVVASGSVIDERLALGGTPVARKYNAGAVYSVGPAAIHRVRTDADDPGTAVTIHAYSPPLARMGAYEVGEDGTLQRFPLAADEELSAPTAAGL